MLTDTKIRIAKPRVKPYKLSDQGGLYLFVSSTGGKSWRYDYRLAGKREGLTIGRYPETTLSEARKRHAEARRQAEKGASPALQKQQAKRLKSEAQANTFRAIADKWYAELVPHRSRAWRTLNHRWLAKEVYPAIGSMDAKGVTPADVLAIIRGMEARGIARSADHVRQMVSRVFQYAIRNLHVEFDPAQSLKGVLMLPRVKSYTPLNAKDIPAFVEAVDAYHGKLATKIAVKLILYTFVRKCELLRATWDEVDFERAEWRIPAERMKMGEPHIVPLSRQALECFRTLTMLACGSPQVLPHHGDPHKPMSPSTVNKMFGIMGYVGRFTPHGLRATASTILNEQGFKPDVIERQLAHTERNRIRAAYNRAEYLDERRAMMQAWADYIDALRSGSNVVAIRA